VHEHELDGYASPQYLVSLRAHGTPRALPRSGGWLIERAIPGTPWVDLAGPYPLLDVPRWEHLAHDLECLDRHDERPDGDASPNPADPSSSLSLPAVSVVAVLTPFCPLSPESIRVAFPRRCAPYKQHLLVDLRHPAAGHPTGHHARNLRKARQAVQVDVVSSADDLAALGDDWCELYGALRDRHRIAGPSDFSPEALRDQLGVPGMVATRARVGGRTVAMALWLRRGEQAYYHLGASSPEGYALRASYALFATAIEVLAVDARWLDLGAGAGALASEDDGLTRFKRGWSTDQAPSWLCGRVLDEERYASLSGHLGDEVVFFPAYRAAA
jgi:hypothetical protein